MAHSCDIVRTLVFVTLNLFLINVLSFVIHSSYNSKDVNLEIAKNDIFNIGPEGILLLATSCGETEKTFHPSRSLWPLFISSCNPETNIVDGNEAGQILSFLIQNYESLKTSNFKKLVLIHAHDVGNHYHVPIWEQLKIVTNSNYFKKSDFGNLYSSIINITFRQIENGPSHWFQRKNMVDVFKFLFQNTSLESIKYDFNFITPTNAAFFVSRKLIFRQPISFYKQLLRNLRIYVNKHCCEHNLYENTCKKTESGDRYNLDANAFAGGVFERAWAIIFCGSENVQYEEYGEKMKVHLF